MRSLKYFCFALVVVLGAASAHAGGRYLWAQEAISTDSVKVRRVLDAEAGVYCYVASDESFAKLDSPMPLAISCVKK